MGRTTCSLLKFDSAIVRKMLAYFIPALHGFSKSLETRLHYMLARSLRVCLGVPRATSGVLLLAKATEPSYPCTKDSRDMSTFLKA